MFIQLPSEHTVICVRLCLHPDIGPRLHSFSNRDVAPLESAHRPVHLADKPNHIHTSVLGFNNTSRCPGSLVTVEFTITKDLTRCVFFLHLYFQISIKHVNYFTRKKFLFYS
jgi:hypothetical protein